jgi:hypothetical protein
MGFVTVDGYWFTSESFFRSSYENVEKIFDDLQNESNQVLRNHVYKSLLQTSKDYKKYVNKFLEFH